MSDTKERLTRKAGIVKKALPDRGEVYVRVLNTDQVLAIGEETKTRKETICRCVSDCIVEQDGSAVFTAEEVRQLDWPVVDALCKLAMEVNQIQLTDERLKDAEKN